MTIKIKSGCNRCKYSVNTSQVFMDIIVLRSLKVQTIIGTLAWERKVPQVLQVTLEIATDTRRAAAEDILAHAVDYTHVAQAVRQFGQENTFYLIETFAEKLSEYLIRQFQISWIKIQVLKPKVIPEAEAVGVILERHGNLIPQSK